VTSIEPPPGGRFRPTFSGELCRSLSTERSAICRCCPPESWRGPRSANADLVHATFTCIGVPFEFKTGTWPRLLPSVIAGQSDLMRSNLYYTPTRAEQVDFVTYLLATARGLVHKGNPSSTTLAGRAPPDERKPR
jgi:ABC-type amino acid transport substrate-binding protein